MTKKLYVVEVKHTAYVWAESEDEAEYFADQIVNTENLNAYAHPALGNELGWDGNCLVYHEGSEDLHLKDVLP